jgi:hypothetical protein
LIELGQSSQRRFRPAATVEQSVDLFPDLPQAAQVCQPARNPRQEDFRTCDARLGEDLDLGDTFGDIGDRDSWLTHKSHFLMQLVSGVQFTVG